MCANLKTKKTIFEYCMLYAAFIDADTVHKSITKFYQSTPFCALKYFVRALYFMLHVPR